MCRTNTSPVLKNAYNSILKSVCQKANWACCLSHVLAISSTVLEPPGISSACNPGTSWNLLEVTMRSWNLLEMNSAILGLHATTTPCTRW